MSPSSAFGAQYSMESPTTAARNKLSDNFNMIAQISPSTVRSSLLEQEFSSQIPKLGAAAAASPYQNENSNTWIDFGAENDFQQIEDLFAAQKQEQQQQQLQQHNQHQHDDTSSIPVGSNVDLGGSLGEELDFGDDEAEDKLDSEMVDDEGALQLMKAFLNGPVSMRTKQILLSSQLEHVQRQAQSMQSAPPKPGTLNQRLAFMNSHTALKPPRHTGGGSFEQAGDASVSIHSDGRKGSVTNQTYMSSFSSGMSLSTNPEESTTGNSNTIIKKKSSSGKSKKKSDKKSDKKSSKKKKKKSKSRDSSVVDENDLDDSNNNHGYSAYLPLDDDGSACMDDAILPDGSIMQQQQQLSGEKAKMNKKSSTTQQLGDSLINFLHSSLKEEALVVR